MSNDKSFTQIVEQNTVDSLKEIQNNSEFDKKAKQVKLRAKLRELSDGAWNPVEDALLDVEVYFHTKQLIGEIERVPTVPKLAVKLKEQPELLEILIESIPNKANLRGWRRKRKWKEEVERRMRDETLFAHDKRFKMIDAVYQSGLKGSAKHAQMYLTMSGDLNKTTEQDPVQKTFEDFTKALSKKRSEDPQ